MREKIKIARQLNISRKNFSKRAVDKKLFSKIYRTYIIECIIKRKDKFELTFNGVYLRSFGRRIKDWWNYIMHSNIYYRPVHLKITNTPDEFMLEGFLKENGFKIVEEHLYGVSTVYDIARI